MGGFGLEAARVGFDFVAALRLLLLRLLLRLKCLSCSLACCNCRRMREGFLSSIFGNIGGFCGVESPASVRKNVPSFFGDGDGTGGGLSDRKKRLGVSSILGFTFFGFRSGEYLPRQGSANRLRVLFASILGLIGFD